jgi:translation initiation factor IF-2
VNEPKSTTKKKPGGREATPKARPAIKLAPLPKISEPKLSESKSGDLPAQKPDMKLPADVLGAAKTGGKPLSAHLRRSEHTHDTTTNQSVKPAGETTEGRSGRKDKARRGTQDAQGKWTENRPMLGGREQRQLQRRRSPKRTDDEQSSSRPNRRLRRSSGLNTAAPRKEKIALQLPCSVRELSEAAGVAASQIQRILLEEGVMARITDTMEPEMTELVAVELGINVEFKQAVSFEEQILEGIRVLDDDPSTLVERPPVVTFLGHVDHGKTSLLDRIIGIDVVSGESGGITQHIRAYTIEKAGRSIAFVDTPGHEAFTEMRARGADVTDIAVLVVAADDGVMPQTEEAISHARAADVPIVVALNKMDLVGVDENKALQGLTANELVPSEWGGDVEVVKTSAETGLGLDELLETMLTVAELNEYKANPDRLALGTCLEAQQEAGRGVVAKVIVQNGTLRVGDILTCGHAFGRVKAMYDTLDTEKRVDEAGPSVPVNLIGLDTAPNAGERFYVLDDIVKARSIAESRTTVERTASLSNAGFQHVTLENLFDRLESTEEVQILNLILRADMRGSIEAIQKEFQKLDHPEVRIKILQATVGGVTEADVTLADASDAIIIGFNVVPDEGARQMADRKGVQIRAYSVIYKITEDLKAALEGMLKPEEKEIELGRALVQQIFKISRIGTIAGCRVLSGTIERNGGCRIIRDNTVIGDYPIDTLRREKDDTKQVREGFECGIKLSGFNDIKQGDVLEAYKIESIDRSFDD